MIPQKEYCIIIPFHNPVSWHTDYANQTARLLARRHHVLCFLWGNAVSLKEIVWNRSPYHPIVRKGRQWMYQPLFLIPGKRVFGIQVVNLIINALVVYLLCAIACAWHRRKIVLWFFGFFDPAFLYLPASFPRIRIIYDCVDYPWHIVPRFARAIKKAAFALCRRAWIVTANSKTLTAMLKRVRDDVITVPLGFRKEMFRTPSHAGGTVHTPVIGFIGAIDYRLDYRLLEKLIRQNPMWQFALIGRVFGDFLPETTRHTIERLLHLPNVMHTSVSSKDIPAVLTRFSVAIIPYTIRLPFNRYAFPMKVMEYLYAGKRIVATPIRELSLYAPYVRCASSHRTWEALITHALHHPPSIHMKREMRLIARRHTWENKLQKIMAIVRSRE